MQLVWKNKQICAHAIESWQYVSVICKLLFEFNVIIVLFIRAFAYVQPVFASHSRYKSQVCTVNTHSTSFKHLKLSYCQKLSLFFSQNSTEKFCCRNISVAICEDGERSVRLKMKNVIFCAFAISCLVSQILSLLEIICSTRKLFPNSNQNWKFKALIF